MPAAAREVLVEGCALPLGQRRYSFSVQPGETLAAIVHRAAGDAPVAVQIGGEPVPPELWSRIRPRAGATVNVAPIAGPQLLLLTLASIAVGAAVAFLLPKPGSPEDVEQSIRLEGGTNRQRPYEPFPVLLGRLRYAPPVVNAWIPYIAGRSASGVVSQPGQASYGNNQPVARGDDGKQWIRSLLCWGLGRIEVSDVHLDRTPATDFGSSVAISTTTGDNPDFPAAVRRVKIGADLNAADTVQRADRPRPLHGRGQSDLASGALSRQQKGQNQGAGGS